MDATPGSPTGDSFCSVVDADAYHVTHVAAETWSNYSTDEKERALIQATRQLSAYVTWYGYATVPGTQVLPWPRIGLVDPGTLAVVSNSIYPDRLKWATAEQARLILGRDRSLETSQGQDGIRKLVAGSVELEFADPTTAGGVLQAIAPSAWQFVSTWGEMAQAGVGGATRLRRSIG